MAEMRSKLKDPSREEDYRDYEQRDVGDGWPYADEDHDPASRNAPYGKTPSNFDESGDIGAEIAPEPEIEASDEPLPIPVAEPRAINDDGIEERIHDALESLEAQDAIDSSTFEVTVHNSIALIEGRVETETMRHIVEQAVLSIKGIRGCNNHLVTLGVDDHIPSDADT